MLWLNFSLEAYNYTRLWGIMPSDQKELEVGRKRRAFSPLICCYESDFPNKPLCGLIIQLTSLCKVKVRVSIEL